MPTQGVVDTGADISIYWSGTIQDGRRSETSKTRMTSVPLSCMVLVRRQNHVHASICDAPSEGQLGIVTYHPSLGVESGIAPVQTVRIRLVPQLETEELKGPVLLEPSSQFN